VNQPRFYDLALANEPNADIAVSTAHLDTTFLKVKYRETNNKEECSV
jgi:hypothetical protein